MKQNEETSFYNDMYLKKKIILVYIIMYNKNNPIFSCLADYFLTVSFD